MYFAASVLSVWGPLPSYDPILPPLTHCKRVYKYTYSHREGGEEMTREKVRGEVVHKTGRKFQHD